MENRKPVNTLNGLVGHLHLESTEALADFNQLTKSLSKSAFEESPHAPERSVFSFERSDLFAAETIADVQKKAINAIIASKERETEEAQYKVYRREVPVIEPLLQRSVADWAAGAKVDHTIGPFNSLDGRQFWYDFYPIETFVALYMQGQAEPVLLFKVRQGRSIISEKIGIAHV